MTYAAHIKTLSLGIDGKRHLEEDDDMGQATMLTASHSSHLAHA